MAPASASADTPGHRKNRPCFPAPGTPASPACASLPALFSGRLRPASFRPQSPSLSHDRQTILILMGETPLRRHRRPEIRGHPHHQPRKSRGATPITVNADHPASASCPPLRGRHPASASSTSNSAPQPAADCRSCRHPLTAPVPPPHSLPAPKTDSLTQLSVQNLPHASVVPDSSVPSPSKAISPSSEFVWSRNTHNRDS